MRHPLSPALLKTYMVTAGLMLAGTLAACGDEPPTSVSPECLPGTLCPCTPGETVCPTGETCQFQGSDFVCVATGTTDAGIDAETTPDAQTDTPRPPLDVEDDVPSPADVVDADSGDPGDGTDAAEVDVEEPSDVPVTADADTTSPPDVSEDTGGADTGLVPVNPLDNPWVAFQTDFFQCLNIDNPGACPGGILRGEQVAITRRNAPAIFHVDINARFNGSPAFSPDGTQLVMYSQTSLADAQQLVRVNLRTAEVVPLPGTNTGRPQSPSWDPAGRYIVYDAVFPLAEVNPDPRRIFIHDLTTGESRRLTNTLENNASVDIVERHPRFARDGRVYFTTHALGSRATYGVASIRPDGTDLRVEVDFVVNSASGPITIFPDGSQVWMNDVGNGSASPPVPGVLIRFPLDGSGSRNNIAGSSAHRDATMSPDGQFMIVQTQNCLPTCAGDPFLQEINPFTGLRSQRIAETGALRLGSPAIAPVESNTIQLAPEFSGDGT
jgi:Tol biopolymer transport system component